LDRIVATTVRWVPRPLVGRLARRYVAGPTLDDGVQAARRLMREGSLVTFDHLGEFITALPEGEQSATIYKQILERIRKEQLEAGISLKLSSFGLLLDEEAALNNVRAVLLRARELDIFVRLDMEDSPTHDATFRIYRALREEGFSKLGLVLQARMRRALLDLEALHDLTPSYRLCKGIYLEPEEVAYQGFQEIQENYLLLLARILDLGSQVGIATHDPHLVEEGEKIVKERGLGNEAFEFQMLLGVAPRLRARLLEQGYRLRIYVPFGQDWYAYCVRRLQENPAIGGHVLRALFRR